MDGQFADPAKEQLAEKHLCCILRGKAPRRRSLEKPAGGGALLLEGDGY